MFGISLSDFPTLILNVDDLHSSHPDGVSQLDLPPVSVIPMSVSSHSSSVSRKVIIYSFACFRACHVITALSSWAEEGKVDFTYEIKAYMVWSESWLNRMIFKLLAVVVLMMALMITINVILVMLSRIATGK